MAHYFIFPQKDTTIYSGIRGSANAGLDETLTLEDNLSKGNRYPSRILIQFKDSEINNVINNIIPSDFTSSLYLWATEHSDLTLDQHFELYPLAQEWAHGNGRITNEPRTQNGVTWRYTQAATTSSWFTDNYPTGVTASYVLTPTGIVGGGTWYTGSGFEITRSYSAEEQLDLEFDITTVVKKHYSSSYLSSTYPNGIPNYGFILKRSASQEFDDFDNGTLRFFGVNTHTIYPPYIDFAWDDSSYDTTFATEDKILKEGEIFVTLRNNKKEFKKEETPKFRLNVRELYPTRRFVTSSNYLDVKYFTSKSYYSVIDYATEDIIVPFDENTKLSADSQGMYFKMYMNGLEEERYYKLLFKHENNDGISIFDENYYFKITRS